MKLTKEDIQKYGTEEEKKLLEDSQLKRSKMADDEYYYKSVYNDITKYWDQGSKTIIKIIRDVHEEAYDKGYNEGYADGQYYMDL